MAAYPPSDLSVPSYDRLALPLLQCFEHNTQHPLLAKRAFPVPVRSASPVSHVIINIPYLGLHKAWHNIGKRDILRVLV